MLSVETVTAFWGELEKISASTKEIAAAARRIGHKRAKDPMVRAVLGFTIPTAQQTKAFQKVPPPDFLGKLIPKQIADRVTQLHSTPGRIVASPASDFGSLGAKLIKRPVGIRSARAFRNATVVHEGFERSVKTPDWSSMGHLSPEVLLKEHNLLSKLTGPGSKTTRDAMRKMRSAGGETKRLEGQFMDAFQDPRALQFLQEGNKVPKAMRKAFLRNKRTPLTEQDGQAAQEGLSRAISPFSPDRISKAKVTKIKEYRLNDLPEDVLKEVRKRRPDLLKGKAIKMEKRAAPKWAKMFLSLPKKDRARLLSTVTKEREIKRLGFGGERIADLVTTPQGGMQVRKIPLLKATGPRHRADVEGARTLQKEMENYLRELTGGKGRFSHLRRQGPGHRAYYDYVEGPTLEQERGLDTAYDAVTARLHSGRKERDDAVSAFRQASRDAQQGGSRENYRATKARWEGLRSLRQALEAERSSVVAKMRRRVPLDDETEATLSRLKERYPGLHDVRASNIIDGTVVDVSPQMDVITYDGSRGGPGYSRRIYLGKTAGKLEKSAEIHLITGGTGAGKSTEARRRASRYDHVFSTDIGKVVGGEYAVPADKVKARADKEAQILNLHRQGKKVLVEGYPKGLSRYSGVIANANKLEVMGTRKMRRIFRVLKRHKEQGRNFLSKEKGRIFVPFSATGWRPAKEDRLAMRTIKKINPNLSISKAREDSAKHIKKKTGQRPVFADPKAWMKKESAESKRTWTPSMIHRRAGSYGIVWDSRKPESAPFIAMCKRVTGKEHLDDMSPEELKKVAIGMTKMKLIASTG